MRAPRRSRSELPRAASRRAALLACALLATSALAADRPTLKAGVFEPARMAPEFSLAASDGGELTLARFRGKVVVLAFGFTSCTNVCPVTMSVLAQARKELGEQGDEFQVVYVTVDPGRDDVATMRKYLAFFDPTFIGGTGSEEQLAAVREKFGIASKREKTVGDGYSFAHSSYTYLIDRAGILRALMPYGNSAADYVHDVRILLQERPSEAAP